MSREDTEGDNLSPFAVSRPSVVFLENALAWHVSLAHFLASNNGLDQLAHLVEGGK